MNVLMAVLFLSLSLLTQPSHAAIDLTTDDRLTLRGFGTLGGACFSSTSYQFIREDRPNGPGKSRECDTGIDSNIGLQMDGYLTDRLQFTGQAVIYHLADNRFEPELSQANLRWNFAENNYLRLGRMQSPFSLVSEYRNIGFAQPWVRAPSEVYRIASGHNIEGVELSHEMEITQDWRLNLTGGVANFDEAIPNRDGTHNVSNFNLKFGYLDARFTHQDWLIKSTVVSGNIDYAPLALTDTLDKVFVKQGNAALAKELSYRNKTLVLYTLGVRYETEQWLVQSEYVFRDHDVWRIQQAAYLFAGKHVGDWMPYSILARAWSESLGKEKKATNALEYRVAAALIHSGIDDRTSFALGLSRKLYENAVLKFQLDFIRPDSNSTKPDNIEQLTTLNLDFIF